MFCHENITDNYTTTFDGWKSIIEYIPKDKKIYSPFYSDGCMKTYFKKLGFDIIHKNEDFFECYNKYNYDIIIDNPPFSKRKKVFQKLKEIDKPFIIICLSTVFHCKYFTNMFKDHLQIIIPKKRTKFFNINNPNKSNYTPPLGTLFYCYKMNLKKDIIFL